MADKRFPKAALLLLVLAVPATVAIVAVRRSGTGSGRNDSASAAAPKPRRTGKVKPFVSPEEELRTRQQDGEDAPRTDAPEAGDAEGGDLPEELARFGTRGTKAVKFGALAWSPGMKWKVETFYRLAQHGINDLWANKSILWNYEVVRTEKLDGRDVWVVSVQPDSLAGMPYNPGGTVYIDMNDHTVYAVRDRVQERGSVRERYLKFEDGDGAPSILFPTEVPPPGTEGRERTSHSGTPAPDPFNPDPKSAPPAKSSGTVVDVTYEVDGVTLRQRWDSAVPYWPLYSSTPTSVSYLRAEP